MNPLSPNRPYLLRAYYEWLMDNHLTPHLVVDVAVEGTQVPMQYVKDGQIVLNIAQMAVASLELGNEFVEFNARFDGVSQHIILPLRAIIAIYARENGAGVVFEMEEAYIQDSDITNDDNIESDESSPDDDPTPPTKKSHLRVVK